MQKIYLMLVLMPMFSMASDRTQEIIRQGVAVMVDWAHPEIARDIQTKHYMDDVAWLSLALGRPIDPSTPMLNVMITDEGSCKYWHLYMAFKHPTQPEKEIYFPRWLPRIWFQHAHQGAVRTPRLFGVLYKIVCPQPDKEEGEIAGAMD